MSSKLYDLGLNELRPSHNFSVQRSTEGLWTASHEFSCRYVDHANDAIKNKLSKGTAITQLDSNLPIFYNFITLESHTVEHQRGGITKIRARFSGASDDDGFTGGDNDRSVSYSYRGILGQKSII